MKSTYIFPTMYTQSFGIQNLYTLFLPISPLNTISAFLGVRDPLKGISCELASMTPKYNSWPPNTPLTLALIHHMGWITVLIGFGVMHTPTLSQTLIMTGL